MVFRFLLLGKRRVFRESFVSAGLNQTSHIIKLNISTKFCLMIVSEKNIQILLKKPIMSWHKRLYPVKFLKHTAIYTALTIWIIN